MNMWMSEQRIRELADVVEGLEAGCAAGQFSMAEVAHPCGSPACIAGWTVHLYGNRDESHRKDDLAYAAELLGLEGDSRADDLFLGDDDAGASIEALPDQDNFISPERAAVVLRHLARTGKVDWTVADPWGRPT